MTPESAKVVAVLGATGAQGGGVVRALTERRTFRVRALTRHPGKAKGMADEVAQADLDQPETLRVALDGVYGVFSNTNSFAGPDTDEIAQGRAVVDAARAAGVEHFIWSTLPNVDAISRHQFHVAHFTNKATVNEAVRNAGFKWFTFVEPPFYYQNLTSPMYEPLPGPTGTPTWSVPMKPGARGIHMGDITELGNVVSGALEQPEIAGEGLHLALAGDLMSWEDIVATLNGQGHNLAYAEATNDPWGIRDMFAFFEAYTYFGPDAEEKIANAKMVSTRPFTDFATWAKSNMPAP